MKNICLYFQVHHPFRLQPYHFFDVGSKKNYFDKHTNAAILRKVASKCYLPTNQLLHNLINQYNGQFKVSFSISGLALEQFELYAPEVIVSFQQLAKTGRVEFLAETYAHSLAFFKSELEFIEQIDQHTDRIHALFGQQPKVFRNTELIYTNRIGHIAHHLGFKGVLTEGTDQILGWRSPNYLYNSAANPQLRLLLKNYRLSDDIAFRFGDKQWKEWPVTAHKYVNWLEGLPAEDQIVNLFMDYETFGEHQWKSNGIFRFLTELPSQIASSPELRFTTPSEAINTLEPIASLQVPHPISWADEKHDLSAWLGNDLQDAAFDYLYSFEKKVLQCNDPEISRTWNYLQSSDHFYYMCTKESADGAVHSYFNPYRTPFEAFINYMNVLGDFEIAIDEHLEHNAPKKAMHKLTAPLLQSIELSSSKTHNHLSA